MKRIVVQDVKIKKLDEGVKPYGENEVKAAVWGMSTHFNTFERWIMKKLESVQALNFNTIIAELALLKIAMKDISER